MTTLKSLLFLTSMTLCFGAFAQQTCLYKDQVVAPPVPDRTILSGSGETVDTQVWIDWKAQAGTESQINATKSLACCANLTMHPTTRVCTDKSMEDTTLVKCSSQADCSGNKGCFPMREDDMFKLDDNSTEAQVDAVTANQGAFEEQQASVMEPQPIGGMCQRNMDCESYNCQRGGSIFFSTCRPPQTICRLAVLNEVAMGTVKCEEPLVKDATEKCYDPTRSTFKGPLGVINVVPTDPNKCQFALHPTAPGATPTDVQPAIDLAIGTTRGLEWLFSTATHGNDCMKVIDYLKAKILELITKRKEILRDYSINTKNIEEHFAVVNAAQKDDMSPILTLCDDTTTKHDVALRRATGLDYLCYMKKRNAVFTAYETDMLIWTGKVNDIIKNYQANVFSWDEDSKDDWMIGENSYSWRSKKCRYYINLLLGVITPKQKKKRWGNKYNVSSHGPTSQIIDSEHVSKYLSYIGDQNTPRAMKRGYFLDPIMPGGPGMGFQDFGNGRGMFTVAGAVMAAVNPIGLLSGIGNGPEYNRNLRNGEMATMYSRYEGKIVEHLKGLRQDVPPEQFIAEPEMRQSYEYRGCLDKINAPECVKFKQYVGKIRDIAFAQFLAYSKHHQSRYSGFYQSAGTFRRKLWNRYTVDLTNLENYYTAVGQLRAAQNICIDKVIKQLQGGSFHVEGMGLTEGEGNYYNPTENNYTGGSTPIIKTKPVLTANQNIIPYQISLGVYNQGIKAQGLKDNMSSSTGGGAGSLAAGAAGSLAARNKEIADANAKAKAAGIDVAKADKEIRDSLRPTSATGAGAAGGAASSTSAAGSGATGNKATLDEVKEAKTESSDLGVGSGKGGAGTSGAAIPGAGVNNMAGIVGGSASGATAATEALKEDPSGMSDEEKDRMAANYDRTKNQYKPSEEDSLFQVVSKTYVRNLDKVLTRKKKLEEDAASAPSSPSTP